MLGFWHRVFAIIYLSSIARPTHGLRLAIVTHVGRQEIRDAVNLALQELRASPPNAAIIPLESEHYYVNTDAAGEFNALSRRMCEEIALNSTMRPDIIVDLTLLAANRCLLRYLARQLDTGLMTADPEECPSFKISPNAVEPGDENQSIGVPSIRIPGCASVTALSAVSSTMLRSLNHDTVFFSDVDLGPNALFSDFGKLEFVGRYFIRLDDPLDPEKLFNIAQQLFEIVRAQLWTVKIQPETMRQILMAVDQSSEESNLFETEWLIYDESLDMTTCNVLCYTDDNGKKKCGVNRVQKSFFCLKIDLQDADLVNLKKVEIAVGEAWTNPNVDNLDIVFSYEAIKTSAIAYILLKTTGHWEDKIVNLKANECQSQPPQLTTATRYYKFANAIRTLPTRKGVVGDITFNGSIFNYNANFRLWNCTTHGDVNDYKCVDLKSIYSYGNNSIRNPEHIPLLGQGLELRVLVIPEPPFVIKTNTGWSGYSVEVFKYIAEELHLGYKFIEQEDHTYGVKLPDGKWNGMIGQIASKHADVALGPVIQDSERKLVVDFTIPYYDSAGLSMLISINQDQELGPFFFLEVFTTPVWACCICAVAVVSILVYVLDRFSPYSFQNQAELTDGPSEGTLFTLKESIWYVLGACTQQGESLDPRSTSTRILITGHWIFVVIMVSMFSANLSARLTVSGLREEIKSLEQLAAQTDVRYTVRNNSAEYAFFRKMYEVEESLFKVWLDLSMNFTESTSNYSVWQYPITERYGTIFKRMSEWGFTGDTDDSLSRVRKGWVVFMESPLADHHIATSCDLRQLGERIGSWQYGIALPPKSFLTPNLNSIILRMKADNKLDELETKWWSTTMESCPETNSGTGFGMRQVGGMFILLACGFVAGAIILVIEIVVYRIIVKRAEKRKQIVEKQVDPKMEEPSFIGPYPLNMNGSAPTVTAIVIHSTESEIDPIPPTYAESQQNYLY